MSPDGRLVLDAEGLDDETLEAASTLHEQTLESLVAGCLNPEHLAAEDDPVGDLTQLRGQLVRGLAHIDDTLAQLKRR
jgi:hypothetical protein